MTRYPQSLSLATVVVLAASCSLPILKDDEANEPGQGSIAPARPISSVQIDFHRVPTAAVCLPGGCWKTTLKTLAVDNRPLEAPLKPASFAVEKLLGEPHTVATVPSRLAQAGAQVPVSERELSVYFGYADATLTPEARTSLDMALRDVSRMKRVAIRGRTDGLGASPANQRLALLRANAVRTHLRARSPSLAHLIEVDARGSCCYVAPNTTAGGRAQNRRVEITFVRQDPDA